MNWGDACWFTFRPPDKRRPVLILTRSSAIPHLNRITVAYITTQIRDIPSEVLLSSSDGMPEVCAVNLDTILSAPKDSVGRVITHLSRARMSEVRAALLFALGFDEV